MGLDKDASAQAGNTNLEVDIDSFTGNSAENGVKAFYITVRNPAPAARNLDIYLYSLVYGSANRKLNHTYCKIVIPPDSTQSFHVYHQFRYNKYNYQPVDAVQLEVYENGQPAIIPKAFKVDFDDTPHFNTLVLADSNKRLFPDISNSSLHATVMTDILGGSEMGIDAKHAIFQPRDARLLPASWIGYGVFDVIVLNNYPMEMLTPEQRQALFDWYHAGGTIIVSPGADRNWLLSPFMKRLLPENTADLFEPKIVQTADGVKGIYYALRNNAPPGLDVLGETVLSINAFPNLKFVMFDLSESFYSGYEATAFAQSLLGSVPVSFVHAAFLPLDNRQGTTILAMFQSYLREHFSFRPAIGYILLLVIIYILVVAPLNYFYMKKRKMHAYIVLSIPVIALFFSILAFFLNTMLYGISNKADVHTFAYKSRDGKAVFNINFMFFQPSSTDTFAFKSKDNVFTFVAKPERYGDYSSYGYYEDDGYHAGFEAVNTVYSGGKWDVKDYKISSRATVCLIGFSVEEPKTPVSDMSFRQDGDNKVNVTNFMEEDIDNGFLCLTQKYAEPVNVKSGQGNSFTLTQLDKRPVQLYDFRELEPFEIIKNTYTWFILKKSNISASRGAGIFIYETPAPGALPFEPDASFGISDNRRYVIARISADEHD
ncbi:MAG: hypothetical protein HZA48_03515 [Planctomycetes bacterium]|nr:hypothetical protein [Planctomycetota bacterium]